MAYLPIKTVAERLHCSYVKIWQMCRSGHIPAYRIGRLWRIKEEDIEKKHGKWNWKGEQNELDDCD